MTRYDNATTTDDIAMEGALNDNEIQPRDNLNHKLMTRRHDAYSIRCRHDAYSIRIYRHDAYSIRNIVEKHEKPHKNHDVL